MIQQYDAIIIGAGPAGSTVAILLAQAGWHVALVEKQDFPRRKVCGECIAASNFPILDKLGIGTAVTALAGPALQRVAVWQGKHSVSADLPPLAGTAHPWGKALGREILDTLLLERAKQCGVDVLQPWAVKHVHRSAVLSRCELVQVRTRETAQLQSPVVIAAHGSWQLEPDEQRSERPARASDLFGFKANFDAPAMKAGLLSVLGFAGGYGGMVLGDHRTATLACCIRRDVLMRLRADGSASRAAEAVQSYLTAQCTSVAETLSTATLTGSWLSVGPLRPGIRIGKERDGIFRIGNAAGEAHPIIGEGMSMAFQSALLCATLLGPHRDRLGDPDFRHTVRNRYEGAWRRHFASRIRLAAIFAHAAMRPLAADAAMKLLHRTPSLLTHAARMSGKVTQPPAGTEGIPYYRTETYREVRRQD